MEVFYTFIIYPMVWSGFWLLSWFNSKVNQGFKLRRNKSWIKAFDSKSQWIWFHVASGELEYAKPVMRTLKQSGKFKILVTYFSPSATRALAKASDVDLYIPMPWDTPWNWNQFLDHYKPQVLAIARTDTWPNMVWQTAKRNIPSILFSATLPSHSGRYASFWGRLFYGSVVEKLSTISCVSESDRDNFTRLAPDQSFTVDGDTRFDQVIYRVSENRPLRLEFNGGPVFVAGSTWPEDEKILIPALKEPIGRGLKAIIAPHEPSDIHLRFLEESLLAHGLKPTRYSELNPGADIILIDQVGILADLYRFAQVAFIGGSFKKSIHSVMEASACGALAIFGPYHFNNREALALKSEKLAVEVTNSEQIRNILLKELDLDPSQIILRKKSMKAFVQKNSGVSLKISSWIKTQLPKTYSNHPQ